MSKNGPLRVGIGGPVGSGKTTLTEMLCKAMRDTYSVAVITNDIYTKEDALSSHGFRPYPKTGSWALKLAAVRTRRSARMPQSTCKPLRR